MRLYDDTLPTEESSLLTTPSSGIGVAPTDPQQPASKEPEGILGKIGKYMTGGYSPHIQMKRQAAARQDKLAQMEELKGTVSALEHGVSMVQGMEGDERAKFVDAYAGRLDKIDAGLGETYRKLADRPDLLSKYKEYVPDLPEHLQVMAKNDPKGFLKFAGTAEGVKALGDGLDRRELRTATKKVQTVMMGYQQLVPPEVAKSIASDGVITASEILSMQQYLPDSVKLTDSQMQAVQRNDKTFWNGLGVLHGDKEQEVLAARAKKEDKAAPPASRIDKRTVNGKVMEQRQTWDGTKWVDEGEAVPHHKPDSPTDIPRHVVDVELRVGDDYARDSKKFSERRPLFDSATDYMANRAKNKTSAGDSALAFAFAKMRDPNDRLAVSETRDLKKLGNLPERMVAAVTALVDKGEILPDRVAKEMYDEIRRAFTEQNRQQARLEKDTEEKVKSYGGEPSRVVRRFAIPEEQLAPKGKSKAGKAKYEVGNEISRGGKRWRVTGFDKDGEPLVEEVRGR